MRVQQMADDISPLIVEWLREYIYNKNIVFTLEDLIHIHNSKDILLIENLVEFRNYLESKLFEIDYTNIVVLLEHI